MNDHAIPIVTLHRALPRRARALHLPPLDFTLGAGIHAVVGTPADGTLAIAKLVGGIEPPWAGQVIVDGRTPARDPGLRAKIGVTLDVPCLPQAKRVGHLMSKVDSLRGGQAATAALADFGLSHWRDRKLEALSRRETRALELMIAVGTNEPVAIALTEPGADIAPINRQVLSERLSRAAAAGACVIIITASMSDAIEHASSIHLLERGTITRWVPVDEAGALVPGRGIVLRVEVDLPRILVAALADDPAVIGIDWDQQEHRSTLSLRGDDVDRLALAIAHAAVSTGASVRSIAPVAPGLEEVRAASSGLALAAYHAAYRSYSGPEVRTAAAPAAGLGPAPAPYGNAPAGTPPGDSGGR